VKENIYLQVRVTKEERERAQELADLTGNTVSDVVRALLRDARVAVRAPLLEAAQPNANYRDLAMA